MDRRRQSRILLSLGLFLAAAGLATALFARKLPVFLRLEAGFWDVVGASAILLFRWQNTRGRR